MNRTFALFAELLESDIEVLFQIAHELRAPEAMRILSEGTRPDALYVVLSGRVALVSGERDEFRLAEAGAGEVLGEIAFLEEDAATLSAVAVEDSLLLAVPVSALRKLIDEDSGFAIRFYRAIALSSLRRLRATSQTLRGLLAARAGDGASEHASWQRLSGALESLRSGLRDADKAALANQDRVPDALRADLHSRYRSLIDLMNHELGSGSPLPEAARRALGSRLQAELLPHLLLSECGERWHAKPRGYAGDYYTIELMYRNQPSGVGRLGPIIDEWMLECPPTRAARNRRELLKGEILREMEQHPAEATRITTLASGPAAEVFDAFAAIDTPDRLRAHLVDIDLQALSFVADRLTQRKLRRQVELHNSNLIYLATGRSHLEIPPQHLVYSVGLIDYFDDRFVVRLLDYVHGLLAPGGRVILGNFHPRNPDRAMMEHVLDWPLILRDEDDMNRLFAASRFGEPCSRIFFEEQQINLFAEGIRR